MSFTMKNVNKIFQNKIVLYILLGLSFLNLLGYLAKNNLTAIIIFLLTGYGTTFFTKNMSYILLIPLLITNFLVALFSMQKLSLKEGYTHNEKDEKDEEEKHKEEENDDHEEKGVDEHTKKKDKKLNPKVIDDDDDDDHDLDDDDNDHDNLTHKEKKINTDKTKEKSLSNLHKIMGSKKFSDMNNLVNDQEALLKSVDKMEPLMNKVVEMMDKFEKSSLFKFLPKFNN